MQEQTVRWNKTITAKKIKPVKQFIQSQFHFAFSLYKLFQKGAGKIYLLILFNKMLYTLNQHFKLSFEVHVYITITNYFNLFFLNLSRWKVREYFQEKDLFNESEILNANARTFKKTSPFFRLEILFELSYKSS